MVARGRAGVQAGQAKLTLFAAPELCSRRDFVIAEQAAREKDRSGRVTRVRFRCEEATVWLVDGDQRVADDRLGALLHRPGGTLPRSNPAASSR
jgi:hypothetical protein